VTFAETPLCAAEENRDSRNHQDRSCFFPGIMSVAESEMISEAVSAAAAPAGLSPSIVFFSLLIPALVLYYVYFRISRRHMLKLAEKIPGPEGLPLIGNALMFLGNSDSKITLDLKRKICKGMFHVIGDSASITNARHFCCDEMEARNPFARVIRRVSFE